MRTPSLTLAALTLVLMLGLIAGPALKAQGPPAANGNYKYIATATTTNVKPTSGYLHTVTINTGAAGAITLFDIAAAGCTGTPASGKFATIRAGAATDAPVTVTYDLATVNGICVVTAQATDLTVSFN
jgi:hypothetical protein